jgi:hypothetical protein
MPKPHEPPLQLTFRPEGLMWNAYLLPPPDSTDRALLIGSILLRIVHENHARETGSGFIFRAGWAPGERSCDAL